MRWMAPLRHLGAKVLFGRKPPADREPSMNEVTRSADLRSRSALGGSGHYEAQGWVRV